MRHVTLDAVLGSLLHACAFAALLAVPACGTDSSSSGTEVGEDDYGDCDGWEPPNDVVLMSTGTIVSLTRSNNLNAALMAEGVLVRFDGWGTEMSEPIPATGLRAWFELTDGSKLVVGDGGQILRMQAGQTEWEVNDSGISEDLIDVVAASDGSWAIAIASNRVLYPSGVGEPWTEIVGPWTGLRRVVVAAGQIWLLGEGGQAWTTSDPLGAWESVELGTSADLIGAFEPTCTGCVVLLSPDALHVRTDGQWSMVPAPEGESFTAAGGGYVVTDQALYEFEPATGLTKVVDLDFTPTAVTGVWEFALVAGSAGELVNVRRIVCLGRPWVIDGAPATATLLDTSGPGRWARDGLYEHASVASFARFVRELLALGAPPALVRAAQAAILDELEHAQLCFELAAREHGPVKLGPLPLDQSSSRAGDPVTLALAVFEEGCIGETVAAAEAGVAAAETDDADARTALERIAADERQHAALAWRTLRWLLDTFGDPVHAALRRRLASLGGGNEVRARVIAELVRPLTLGLLATSPASHASSSWTPK
jgi:hypothetical protein